MPGRNKHSLEDSGRVNAWTVTIPVGRFFNINTNMIVLPRSQLISETPLHSEVHLAPPLRFIPHPPPLRHPAPPPRFPGCFPGRVLAGVTRAQTTNNKRKKHRMIKHDDQIQRQKIHVLKGVDVVSPTTTRFLVAVPPKANGFLDVPYPSIIISGVLLVSERSGPSRAKAYCYIFPRPSVFPR